MAHLAQRQPERRAQTERGEDRKVAVAPSLPARRPPAVEHLLINPQGERAALNQGTVIVTPVRDAIARFRARGGRSANTLSHP